MRVLPISAGRRGRTAIAALALLAVLAGVGWVTTSVDRSEPSSGTALGVVSARPSIPARAPSLPATISLCALVAVFLWTRVATVVALVRSVVRRAPCGRDPPV